MDSASVPFHVVRSGKTPRAILGGAEEGLVPGREMGVHVGLRENGRSEMKGVSGTTDDREAAETNGLTLRLKARAKPRWQTSQTCFFFSTSPPEAVLLSTDALAPTTETEQAWKSYSDPLLLRDESPTLLNA